jgi:general secretion pathway protein H
MDRAMWHRNCAGFSLIEVLVVMIIIALVMSLVGVSINRGLSSAEVRSAARDLMAAVRITRGEAIIRGEEQRLYFNVDENYYRIPARGDKRVDMPDGMELGLLTARSEMASESEGSIRFFPDGSSTGGRVFLTAGDRQWTVEVVWLTGEASLREADS